MILKKFIISNIKRLKQERIDKLNKTLIRDIKFLPKEERYMLQKKLKIRKSEVRKFENILNKFFNETQELKPSRVKRK